LAREAIQGAGSVAAAPAARSRRRVTDMQKKGRGRTGRHPRFTGKPVIYPEAAARPAQRIGLKRNLCGLAPSSPRRFFLSSSYSR
jgi:hypothetical protein